MKKNFSNFSLWILITICICLIWTRFYNLPETLYFWGDIGRDHQMLMEMVQDRKPKLLGPSNSALPFNQSAWYYYLNLPIFVLTGYSAYTTAIMGIVLNIVALFTVYLLFKDSQHSSENTFIASFPILFFGVLHLFHPLVIEQQRSTWNPAFALPFLIISIAVFWKLLKEKDVSKKLIVLVAIGFSFSVAMTYAVVPIVFFLSISFLQFLPKSKRMFFVFYLGIAFFVAFLPHVLFEVRHDFLLTSQLLQMKESESGSSLFSKFQTGIVQLVGFKEVSSINLQISMLIFILTLIGILRSSQKKSLYVLSLIFIFSFLFSLFFVDQFHAHYILGFIVLFFWIIIMLPMKWKVLITSILLFFWNNSVRSEFTQSPHRTVQDLESCAVHVCSGNKEPMFVTAQAWHEFHTGYDYSFFFNKHDCYTRDISTHPGISDTLAVVVDNAEFDPATTDFHELSLFGEKKLQNTIKCSEDISVYIFSK